MTDSPVDRSEEAGHYSWLALSHSYLQIVEDTEPAAEECPRIRL